MALVGGVERKVQGSYHLRFTEGGKRRWKSVGDDAADATTAARKVEATLKAKALGVAVNPFFPDMPTKRIKLADAIAEYKTEVKESFPAHRAVEQSHANRNICTCLHERPKL